MIRHLKVLGLALVAVVAPSAVAAPGAQAGLKVTAAAYPAVLTGFPIQHKAGEKEPFVDSMTIGSVAVNCLKTSSVSTIIAATERLTVISKYEECQAVIGVEKKLATVTMNDCDYVYHGGVKEVEPDKFEKGEVDLVCPSGKSVVIDVFKEEKSEAGGELCQLTVPPFVNKGSVTYINTTGTPDDVDVISTITGIPATRTGSILCGSASQTATLTGSTTWNGFEDKGIATPENGTLAEIKEGPQVGLTVSE